VFKSIFLPLMFCLLVYGIWLTLAAGTYKEKFVKAKDWDSVEGRIVKRDEGVNFQLLNPVTWPKILLCDPSITFSYTVNGKRYVKEDKLPPCLMFARIASRGDYDPQAVNESEEADFDTIMKESAALRQKGPQKEPDDMTKHIYYDEKTKGVALRGLGTMLKNAVPTDEQMDIFRPRVAVKYRPGDIENAVTAKDEIKGYECMFQSGIWSIIIAIVGSAALFFHKWVTKPSEEDLNMQFQGRSSIKY
jgi:hypothetical protein